LEMASFWRLHPDVYGDNELCGLIVEHRLSQDKN
jgi:hypothetical protein